MDEVADNPLAPPLPKRGDQVHRDFPMPTVNQTLAMEEGVLGKMDLDWGARYGDALQEASLVLPGIILTNVPLREE